MSSQQENKREGNIEWINFAKFLAIFAVMVDHTNRVLYSNQHIALASYYAVSLFVLIAGFLNFFSNERHHYSYAVSVIKACKRIVPAYLIATFVYVIVRDHFFDFGVYLNNVIYFKASGPLYYVALYLQLMLVSKLIYVILSAFPKKHHVLYEIGFGIIILCISYFSVRYTNILAIYGGGGKLLGGTYLLLFYIGMLLGKYRYIFDNEKTKNIFCCLISLVLWVAWWRFMCRGGQKIDTLVPFGGGFNPPSITFSVFAVFTFFLSYTLFALISNRLKYITKFACWVGRHTLYIFLYHRLWMDYFLVKYVRVSNKFLKMFLFMGTMILGSIAIEGAFCFAKKQIYNIYKKEELPVENEWQHGKGGK